MPEFSCTARFVVAVAAMPSDCDPAHACADEWDSVALPAVTLHFVGVPDSNPEMSAGTMLPVPTTATDCVSMLAPVSALLIA